MQRRFALTLTLTLLACVGGEAAGGDGVDVAVPDVGGMDHIREPLQLDRIRLGERRTQGCSWG